MTNLAPTILLLEFDIPSHNKVAGVTQC